ncbi:hypothetical protein C8R45DRAFT_941594 [Mycena sanguinolenta]|nr:hypothetical protein C8R45DRAFT_941594 [Mycena sanguinolenta]
MYSGMSNSAPETTPNNFMQRRRAFIACTNCRRRKIKGLETERVIRWISVQLPCTQCQQKGLQCEYPESNKYLSLQSSASGQDAFGHWDEWIPQGGQAEVTSDIFGDGRPPTIALPSGGINAYAIDMPQLSMGLSLMPHGQNSRTSQAHSEIMLPVSFLLQPPPNHSSWYTPPHLPDPHAMPEYHGGSSSNSMLDQAYGEANAATTQQQVLYPSMWTHARVFTNHATILPTQISIVIDIRGISTQKAYEKIHLTVVNAKREVRRKAETWQQRRGIVGRDRIHSVGTNETTKIRIRRRGQRTSRELADVSHMQEFVRGKEEEQQEPVLSSDMLGLASSHQALKPSPWLDKPSQAKWLASRGLGLGLEVSKAKAQGLSPGLRIYKDELRYPNFVAVSWSQTMAQFQNQLQLSSPTLRVILKSLMED